MNLTKHVNVSYQTMNKLSQHIHSAFYVRHEPISYSNYNIFEVVKRKRKIKDTIPVATASFILSHAKLHVLKVKYLYRITTIRFFLVCE